MKEFNVKTLEKFDLNSILLDMQEYNSLFTKLVEISNIHYSESIPTAAVSLTKDGDCLDMKINKDFWDSIDQDTKSFVICHECLHVVLNHGIRMEHMKNRNIANIALDISINHMLVNNFGFNRDKINDWQKYCWTDTIFKDEEIESNKSAEYYYNKLNKNDKFKQKTVDNHDFDEDDFSDFMEDFIEENKDYINSDDIKEFEDILNQEQNSCRSKSSLGHLDSLIALKKVKVETKRKWESIVSKWTKFKCKETETEQWAIKHRRHFLLSKNLFLPSELEMDYYEAERVSVFFFLDTSGSCRDYANRFFKAANSLDKNKFEIRLFSANTRVMEIDINNPYIDSGGTELICTEKYIQSEIKSSKIKKYPDLVFIITDADDYSPGWIPEKPKNWHWFLTESHYKNLVPNGCYSYLLSNFE